MPRRIDSFRHEGLTFAVGDDGPIDGEPVVLVHGFPDTRRAWREVTPLLARAGLRVLTPDKRGDTRSCCPDRSGDYGIDRAAGDVVALAGEAGVERLHLVGHDWGGAVAWQLAADRPDLVASLTVLSTPHPRAMVEALGRSTQLLKSSYFLFLQLPAMPEAVLRARGFAVLAKGLRDSGMPADDVAEVVDRLGDPALLRGALGWYRAARARRPSTGPVSVPTTYVWGDGDVALGHAAAVRTARHVVGPYRFVPLGGASHWLPHTMPEVIAELAVERIRSAPVTRRAARS